MQVPPSKTHPDGYITTRHVVRWLFHKRHLASSKLGRSATWEEAVAEYKSISKGIAKGVKRDLELMRRSRLASPIVHPNID